MKIWFAADIPGNSYGGIARSMHELAIGLKNQGHVVTILNRNTLPGNNYLLFAYKLCIHYLLSIFNRPDWIIARSTDAFFCAVLIRLFRLKTNIILHNHGWEEYVYSIEKKLPHSVVASPTTWKSMLIRFPLLRLMLKLSTYCMSGTEHEVHYLGNKYPSVKNKLNYVPNGVATREDIYWKNQEEYPMCFLTVGNITWKKNLSHTLRVFSLIKNSYSDARLICVGTGVNDTALLNGTGLDLENVTNIPAATFEEMESWYTTCPFMIASSRYEGGHSLAILEALSFGIIVFASAIPSNKEIISDGSNGYLITGSNSNYDAGKIMQKLTIETNQEIRLKASETAKEYCWDNQVVYLENLLCRKV